MIKMVTLNWSRDLLMSRVFYLDRKTKRVEQEKIYGGFFLKIFYCPKTALGVGFKYLLPFLTRTPLFSKLSGWIQKSSFSKRKIASFIEKYQIKKDDFIEPLEGYGSFNEFFIRKLHPLAREIDKGEKKAVFPADGRYLVIDDIEKSPRFFIKGQKFSLEEFIGCADLAKKYNQGAMVIARLCPTDYHRFHFPFHCIPSFPKLIQGAYYSVSPLALRKNLSILCENKRMLTKLETVHFGEVLFVEVGATAVGSIHQTYTPLKPCYKGEEKGYFEFGGSTIVMIFEPSRITFDEDLLKASQDCLEVKGLMGESLGTAIDGFFRY